MKKSDLLKYCRYYKGEDNSPFEEQNKSMLWFYERSWVFDMMQGHSFSSYIDEYIYLGLETFEQFENTPITLKALLFNRYAKGSYSLENEKENFKNSTGNTIKRSCNTPFFVANAYCN